MKQTLTKVAYDYATHKTKFRKDVLKEVDADNYVSRHADCMEDFQCGAEWQSEISGFRHVSENPNFGCKLLIYCECGYVLGKFTDNYEYIDEYGEPIRNVAYWAVMPQLNKRQIESVKL